jgi:hypothetical protein
MSCAGLGTVVPGPTMTAKSEPLKFFSPEWYRHYHGKAVLDREDARGSLKAAEEEHLDPVQVNWFRARYEAACTECAAWEVKVRELEG